MEGETGSSINAVMRFGERVLPTLDNNIKSGNSLIDMDFYDGLLDFEPGIEKKVKPFNWQNAFPDVFKQGGFDCVIGNPPYVRQELLSDFKPYYQKHYKVYHGVADLYSYFIERGIDLLNEKGLFGIIVANKWMRANYGEPLRIWLKEKAIVEIIDFGDLPVFQGATTYPCILIVDASGGSNPSFSATNVKHLEFDSLKEYVEQQEQTIDKEALNNESWHLGSAVEQQLLQKLNASGIPLGEYVKGKIYYGIKTGLNEAFVIDQETRNRLIAGDPRSEEIIKPFLAGRDVKRYEVPDSNKYLIFTKRGIDIENYPAIKKYLLQFKARLMPKPKGFKGDWKGRKPGSYLWHEIQDAVDYYKEFEKPKIILPDIALRMQATYDNQKFYLVNTAYIIPVDDKYLLAILNSSLIQFLYSKLSSSIRGGYFRFIRQYLEVLPIVIDERFENELVHLVEKILQLHKEKQQTNTPDKLSQLETRIKYTDEKIDQLVFDLYGLSEEERKIVEGENYKMDISE
jgi:hypothetical protein